MRARGDSAYALIGWLGVISSLFVLVALIWLAISFKRDVAFLFVSAFLAWQFALKIMASFYLDVFGPIYSDEVFIWVGGHGNSTPFMVLASLVPLVVIKALIPKKARPGTPPPPPERYLALGGFTLADATIWILSLFTVALYIDMIRIGEIPFFAGIERFNYKGGIFNSFLVSYYFLIAFFIGFVTVRERMVVGTWEVRMIPLLIMLFLYLLLTGHRFGVFYVFVTMGLLPFAALVVAPKLGIAVARPTASTTLQRLVQSRLAVGGVALILLMFIAIGMTNSLLYVRDTAPMEALAQRFFVQPAHLYYLTWERVDSGNYSGFDEVYSFLRNPFDPGRNTGIQYLMYLHLGAERAYQVYVRQGVDYAGGYPEIFMEMGGVQLAVLAALPISFAVGLLYRMSIIATLRGRLLTGLAASYLAWAFINVFLGGMVETFVAKTFWAKVVALVLIYTYERSMEARGKRVVNWVLVPKRT